MSTRNAFLYGFTGLALALGMATNAQPAYALGSSLHIEQHTTPSGGYGEWVITKPDGSIYRTDVDTKILNDESAGAYRIAVRPPVGAVATISVYRDSTLLERSETNSANFEVADSDTIRVLIEYIYQGVVQIQSEPAGVSFEMTGPEGMYFTGVTPTTYTNMPPVWYRVTYDTMRDCEAQKKQERNLVENSSLIFFTDLNCGDSPISLAGKAAVPMGTGSERPSEPDPLLHTETPGARIVQTSSVEETLPGGTVRFTVTVRNVTRQTLHDLTVLNAYNPDTLHITSLPGGTLENDTLKWNVNQIFAGQTWSVTFEGRTSENLVAGDRVVLDARVVSADLTPVAWSGVAGVGIAYLPKTGNTFDSLISIAALCGALLLTLTTIRKKQEVALTA